MIKVEYNEQTRRFEVVRIGIDPNDWEKSYWALIADADKELSRRTILAGKNDRDNKIKFKLSQVAEIGYYILHSYANKLKWTYEVGLSPNQLNEISSACHHTLSNIESIIKAFINNEVIEGIHDYKRTKTSNKYIKPDNFNRFVFNYSTPYRVYNIKSILFHHNDELENVGKYKFWMKEILLNDYNMFYADNKYVFNLLQKKVESLGGDVI